MLNAVTRIKEKNFINIEEKDNKINKGSIAVEMCFVCPIVICVVFFSAGGGSALFRPTDTRKPLVSNLRGAFIILCAAPPFLIQSRLSNGIKGHHAPRANPEP